MKTVTVWVIKKLVMIIYYRRFGTSNCPIIKGQESKPLKMGAVGCPETSVMNYHYLLINNPEMRSSHFRV